MLQRAEWAARAFARYDKASVDAIVRAAAAVGAAKAREYAEWAVRAGERLVLGRGAVLTPLARDRARASGVQIEKGYVAALATGDAKVKR